MRTIVSNQELGIDLTTEPIGDKQVQILHCHGYVDATTFEDFQHAVLQPLEQGHYNIILDMAGMTYIHSTGYGLILAAQRQAQAGGGALAVAGFAPKVSNIFHLLGFDQVIPTFSTVDEALQSFH